MSAPLSHNEQVIGRRLADLRALDAGDAQCWENLIGVLKANGKWTPEAIALTLARLVAALMAVEDRIAAEG
jgi:hypothetical protein